MNIGGVGKWSVEMRGGGHVETCKYKIAQFKTQTKDGVGVAGHVGSRATCKEQAPKCPCATGCNGVLFAIYISHF